MQSGYWPRSHRARGVRVAVAAAMAGCLLAGCVPAQSPPPEPGAQAEPDTLYGWLQLVWGGAGSQPSYALTDGAGRTTPLQLSDSLAAAADVRALDRGWVRVIADRAPERGAAHVRAIAPAPPPARP